MRFQFGISNKAFFFSALAVSFILVLSLVIAYNSANPNPAVFGHSAEEVEPGYINSVVGATTISTVSQSYQDMPGMSVTFNAKGRPVLIIASVPLYKTGSAGDVGILLEIDGVVKTVVKEKMGDLEFDTPTLSWMEILPAGTHDVRLKWVSAAGKLTNRGGENEKRVLNIIEL